MKNSNDGKSDNIGAAYVKINLTMARQSEVVGRLTVGGND